MYVEVEASWGRRMLLACSAPSVSSVVPALPAARAAAFAPRGERERREGPFRASSVVRERRGERSLPRRRSLAPHARALAEGGRAGALSLCLYVKASQSVGRSVGPAAEMRASLQG